MGQAEEDSPSRRSVAYVLPVYNEAATIPAFHAALKEATALRPDLDFEFIYVDDGSRDDSVSRILVEQSSDPRVTVVVLSRNFGHQVAVSAGLEHARRADAVIIMDTDLQDPPPVSIELIERWESGADVVNAQRRSRRDSAFKRATAYVFYWLLTKLATIEIPRNVGDFRLLDRKVVLELLRYREHTRFLRGMVAHVGFRQENHPFDRAARFSGTTGYPLRKMIKFAADGVLGFSVVPLRMISRIGFLMFLLSVAGIVFVVLRRLLQPEETVPGWAFLAVVSFLLSGVQLLMLGVVGSYLGRIYLETQNRPLYSVADVIRSPVAEAPPGAIDATASTTIRGAKTKT